MDGILVTKPVGTLDGIVHVPPPVVLVHVSEGGVDATLGSDGVASRGEELRDTGGFEASLGKTEGGAKASAAGADDDSIVLVVLERFRLVEEEPLDTLLRGF